MSLPLQKKRRSIAKTFCEDFREIKGESRNDQLEFIFKMVRIMMSNPSDIAYCFIFNFFINQLNRYLCLLQLKCTSSLPKT